MFHVVCIFVICFFTVLSDQEGVLCYYRLYILTGHSGQLTSMNSCIKLWFYRTSYKHCIKIWMSVINIYYQIKTAFNPWNKQLVCYFNFIFLQRISWSNCFIWMFFKCVYTMLKEIILYIIKLFLGQNLPVIVSFICLTGVNLNLMASNFYITLYFKVQQYFSLYYKANIVSLGKTPWIGMWCILVEFSFIFRKFM